VAHGKAGVSNINTEIIPHNNKHFVLHDSQGFEPGEEDNFEIVGDFIKSRDALPDIKDKYMPSGERSFMPMCQEHD
jgi:hypothetical protein